ncbi:MAG: S1C family serine protease, partial [Verrucomicrobiota bacterium]
IEAILEQKVLKEREVHAARLQALTKKLMATDRLSEAVKVDNELKRVKAGEADRPASAAVARVSVDRAVKKTAPTVLAPNRRLAGTIARDIQNALVLIKTDQGTGSGFLAEIDGVPYIFSNQHVIQGGKAIRVRTVQGVEIKPTLLELAWKEDLARMKFDPASVEAPLTILRFAEGDLRLHEHIVVFGNSKGAGAVTRLDGQLLAVGPDRVEVSAGFVAGNSGSPIVNAAGDVIGVATYITSGSQGVRWEERGTRFERPRRFGFRVTPQVKWVKTSLSRYYNQAMVLQDVSRYLEDILRIVTQLSYTPYRSGASETYVSGTYDPGKKDRFFNRKWGDSIENFYRTFGFSSKRRINKRSIA